MVNYPIKKNHQINQINQFNQINQIKIIDSSIKINSIIINF